MANVTPFKELQFKNSFMFAATMEDPEICKAVLERILQVKIKNVKVQPEASLYFAPEYHAVRLDVYADDETGTVYDVEMQTTDKRNLPKRSRAYQGQMDVAYLDPGEDYNKLPKSYVIFICTYDPFRESRYCYTFHEQCDETGRFLGDETCKIFLNTRGTNRDETDGKLIQFLEYVENVTAAEAYPEDTLLQALEQRIRDLKQSRRLEERYMTVGELMKDEFLNGKEEGLKEGLEKGRHELLKQMVTKKLEKGLKPDQIAELLEISLEEVKKFI